MRHKHLLLSIMMVGGAVFLPVAPAAAASGGGCSTWSAFTGPGDSQFAVQACISASGINYLTGDGYVKFAAANPGLWTNCTVTIHITDTVDGYVGGRQIDCTPDARANAWYKRYESGVMNPKGGHKYETYLNVDAYYQGRYIGYAFQFSPYLTW
ncbi:hypothetical protein ACIBG8_03320 [Nonomuraea sp. NPDC050556]|uniref:hypothetical protein n=1 Tax=Nonomuraea sp. NPDC050556 TaxID=3364369 RepID=UPI00378F2069